MNATLCKITDVELDVCDILILDNEFATAPMAAVRPKSQPIDEEVLHTSFEEAISDRLIALHGRWSNLNLQAVTAPVPSYETEAQLPVYKATTTEALTDGIDTHAFKSWQRATMYMCGALMLIMVGFDLMGLLVLNMR